MTASDRLIDRWFAHYSDDHRHPLNQHIHCIAVPLILWSTIALLWCIPVFGSWFKTGIWAAFAMFTAWIFYNRLSRRLGYGMLAFFFFSACLCRLLEARLGIVTLAWIAFAIFIVAWIAQFIGHRIEGRKPSFLTDLVYLLIGPLWVMGKVYRYMGWRY
ncbi:MAG: DUF962 domain-containing protein [Xanthomonadaceae bacterium]|jgi:uncharacterized membrane protein YGL010W|nr:DUF962 domain-containing protein [Xanthomonadaceae bacterium]